MARKDNYARCSSTIMSYPQFKFSWYGFLERVSSVINFEEGLSVSTVDHHQIMSSWMPQHWPTGKTLSGMKI